MYVCGGGVYACAHSSVCCACGVWCVCVRVVRIHTIILIALFAGGLLLYVSHHRSHCPASNTYCANEYTSMSVHVQRRNLVHSYLQYVFLIFFALAVLIKLNWWNYDWILLGRVLQSKWNTERCTSFVFARHCYCCSQ